MIIRGKEAKTPASRLGVGNSRKKTAILNLARLHGARSIRVYGSVARGQATEQSDLDVVVEWEPDRSLLDVIGLKQDLEDLLGVTSGSGASGLGIASGPAVEDFLREHEQI